MSDKVYFVYPVCLEGMTLDTIAQLYYGTNETGDDLLNYLDNSTSIYSKYNDVQKKAYPVANKNIVNIGTQLKLPIAGKNVYSNFREINLKPIDINTTNAIFWTQTVENYFTNKKNQINFEFDNKQQLFVKTFNKVYIKIYSRALQKVINVSPFIIEQNYANGKTGGSFGFTLQAIEWIYDKDNKVVPSIVKYNGNEFYSKTNIFSNAGRKNNERTRYYFEKVLNPQDLVIIKFDEPFPNGEEEYIDLNTNDNYDMIGLIDNVKSSMTQNENDAEAAIEITGRDLFKVLVEDGTYFFPYEFPVISPTGINSSSFTTRIFGSLNEVQIGGNRTVRELMNFIVNKLKSFTGDLSNVNGSFSNNNIQTTGVWNFINLELDQATGDRLLADTNIATMSGSIINFMKQILQEPLVEIISDTFGNQWNFIARTPPLTKDLYIGNRTINISDKYLIVDGTDLSDDSAYSWFHIIVNGIFLQTQEVNDALFPAIYFPKLANIYGSKKFEFTHNYLYYLTNDPSQNKFVIDSHLQAAQDVKFLVEGLILEPFMRKGSLTFKNLTGIKRGMNLYIPEQDMLYYIENYTHNLTVNERTTVINVSRGIPKRALNLFYSLIDIKIDTATNSISSINFDEDVLQKLYSKEY